MRDFSLQAWQALLVALQDCGYKFTRHDQLLADDQDTELRVALRHDVDRRPLRALAMARAEHELGIVSTFFFRTRPHVFRPDLMRTIAAMGHEIGYHYENLSDCGGDVDRAWNDFHAQLDRFRQCGLNVRSAAMHGRPFSSHDNRDLLRQRDYRAVGIVIEPYLDIDWQKYEYYTDTGRSWNSRFNVKDFVRRTLENDGPETTAQLIERICSTRPARLVISAHPERWTEDVFSWLSSAAADGLINVAKRGVLMLGAGRR